MATAELQGGTLTKSAQKLCLFSFAFSRPGKGLPCSRPKNAVKRRSQQAGRGRDAELANLADTAARGGAVPAILSALASRDAQRRRVATEIAAVKRSSAWQRVQPAARATPQGFPFLK
jgi:hypothetical protein